MALTEARLADVVFARLVVRNDGKEAISLPSFFRRDYGSFSWKLMHRAEQVEFCFGEGGGCGLAGAAALEPGEQRVMNYDMLALPRLDYLNTPFWDPERWRPTRYTLLAYLTMGKDLYHRSYGPEIQISRRDADEMGAIVDWWDGGVRVPPSG